MYDRDALLAATDLRRLADELLGVHAGSERAPTWRCPFLFCAAVPSIHQLAAQEGSHLGRGRRLEELTGRCQLHQLAIPQ